MKQTGLVVGLCLACTLSGAALMAAWDSSCTRGPTTGGTAWVVRSSPEHGQPPAPHRDRARTIGEWQDPDVRTRWLFVSQRGVLDALGMPDVVSGSDGVEYWIYFRPEEGDLQIQFNAGRIAQMM